MTYIHVNVNGQQMTWAPRRLCRKWVQPFRVMRALDSELTQHNTTQHNTTQYDTIRYDTPVLVLSRTEPSEVNTEVTRGNWSAVDPIPSSIGASRISEVFRCSPVAFLNNGMKACSNRSGTNVTCLQTFPYSSPYNRPRRRRGGADV